MNESGKWVPIDTNGSFWSLYKSYGWTGRNNWSEQYVWIYPPAGEDLGLISLYIVRNGGTGGADYDAIVGIGTSTMFWSRTVLDFGDDTFRPGASYINDDRIYPINAVNQRFLAYSLRCLTQ